MKGTKRIDRSIENQPCSENRSRHRWSELGAKFEEGLAFYCLDCHLESMKRREKNDETGLLKTFYFPSGTWYRKKYS